MDKNLLSQRKRAIARITYAGDKSGFRKSGHIYQDTCMQPPGNPFFKLFQVSVNYASHIKFHSVNFNC